MENKPKGIAFNLEIHPSQGRAGSMDTGGSQPLQIQDMISDVASLLSGSVSTADGAANIFTELNNPFLKRGAVTRSPLKPFAASTLMLNTKPEVLPTDEVLPVNDPMNKFLERHSSGTKP